MRRRQFAAGAIGLPFLNAIAMGQPGARVDRSLDQRQSSMATKSFSRSGLRRLHDIMAGYVERRDVPGAVLLIGKRGVVHADVMGRSSLEGSKAMRRDTIFRIASMTKPVTAVAAMMLVE